MHKKQAKKNTKNKVGIHKNVPLGTQVPYEEYEEFLGDYLEIKSYEDIFDMLESDEEYVDCECSLTEEMLWDCLVDERSSKGDASKGDASNGDASKGDSRYITGIKGDTMDCDFLHTDTYRHLLELYNTQKEINKRNREVLKKTVVEPLRYFGKIELLREVDVVLETIFKKRKYKRVKKGIKIFERNQKPVDNLAADEIVERRREFKSIFRDLEYPIPQDTLLEENVELKENDFKKY